MVGCVNMFPAVIFDWDGTLADSKDVIIDAFQKVLTDIGVFIDDEFIEKRIGIGPRNEFMEIFKTENIPFDEALFTELQKKKIEIQLTQTGRVILLEGAKDLLDSLQGKVKMALATMSNREVIDKLLLEKGMAGYFDVVISVDEVVKPKPDPEIFLKSALKLGFPPERCAVVEDSIFGVLAAKEAKMKCIAVATGAYSAEDLAKYSPDLLVRSLKEKDPILRFLLDNNQ